MKMLFICALLIGLVMLPLGVMAEEGTLVEDETAGVNISEEIAIVETNTPNLAPMFGKVHQTLLMATEEAFGYLLTGDIAEKEAFFKELALSEEAMTAFEGAASGAMEDEQVIVTGFDEVKTSYANLTAAADTMFASFETEGKPVMDDVIAFEASVDGVFDTTDKVWDEYNVDGPATVDASVRSLYGRLLAAVQESYAYPVLGDMIEKEDALADFADFDTVIAQYEQKYPDASYDDIKAMKAEIQAAAEAMFASFEENGTADPADVAALETLVEEMNEKALKLFDTSSEETVVIEESSEIEETAVNATA
ncbi:hypothetical protein, partial [Methanospirillum hungatei]|jgi:hypothetical protein|uniref:hypothetical protein n=1 Tax=Methanospirillum hungatei TaxID=2203 RepID=UPI0009D3BCF7